MKYNSDGSSIKDLLGLISTLSKKEAKILMHVNDPESAYSKRLKEIQEQKCPPKPVNPDSTNPHNNAKGYDWMR